MKSTALDYFATFSRKDVDGLRRLLAPDVSLRDWEIRADGIEAVMAANVGIFNATGLLQVSARNLYAEGSTVVGELDIVVGDEPPLKVVDILEFDANNRIRAIRAFKG